MENAKTIKEYNLFVKIGKDTPDNKNILIYTYHTYEEAYQKRGELMAMFYGKKEVHFSIKTNEYEVED